MKLPPSRLDAKADLDEFDIWITPMLGEITDSDKFKERMERISTIFEIVEQATNGFADEDACRPESISAHFIERSSAWSSDQLEEYLVDLADTLFLVTGKSDNQTKCQLPIYLRDEANWADFPSISRAKVGATIRWSPLPRVLPASRFMQTVSLMPDPTQKERLLEKFVSFVLSGSSAVSQLWSLGYSFHMLKQYGREKDILAPLVAFQVRGSVSATGGHEPENALRSLLTQWGLVPGRDFNLSDTIVTELGNGKTRAYDFVLPFETPYWFPKWQRRLFVQSQFYAGILAAFLTKMLIRPHLRA
jgi:hypothetical protein